MASPGKAASLTSALNLDTRLCCRLAVDDDLALTKGPGLKYHSGPSLFDNAAVVNTGTFAEYLRACSVVAPSNFRLSLPIA